MDNNAGAIIMYCVYTYFVDKSAPVCVLSVEPSVVGCRFYSRLL